MHAPRLIVQPDHGTEPVVALLRGAAREILVKMFTFDHTELLEELLVQHRRGVAVRVLLNGAKATGERINDRTFDALRDAGIAVKWTCDHFLVSHEKSVVVDGERALVATFNFMDKYFSKTRDYGLLLSDPVQAGHIRACFEADWRCDPFDPERTGGLAWSPGEARAILCELIDGADHTIDVQHPKFAEPVVFERLHAAVKRGVRVRVLCGGRHGLHQPDLMYSFALWRLMQDVGGKVHKQRRLRVHGKLTVVDGARAYLGTQNLDQPAFDLRREVGVVVDDEIVIETLAATFQADWETSHRYDPPHPILPHPVLPHDDAETDEFGHDADLSHG